MNHHDNVLFKNQSSKSLMKYRSQNIEQRAMRIGKELLVPNIAKRKDTKNVFSINCNHSTNSHRATEPKDDDMIRKVRMLEYELNRKLTEDTLLKNIFKTKHSHEMSHIDLYLQFRNLEDRHSQLCQREQKNKKKIEELELQLKEQEDDHMSNIEELSQKVEEKEDQWFKQKLSLKQRVDKYKMDSENCQFLNEQLQKKNIELINKNKKMSEEFHIEQQSQNLKFIKFKSDTQQQIEGLKEDLEQKLQEINSFREENELLKSHLENNSQSLEGLVDQNEKLQLMVKELEQMAKDIPHSQSIIRKEEKEKHVSECQKIVQKYENQINILVQDHEEIMKKQKERYESKLKTSEREYDSTLKRERDNWKLQFIQIQQEYQGKLKIQREELKLTNNKLDESLQNSLHLSQRLNEISKRESENRQKISSFQTVISKTQVELQLQTSKATDFEKQIKQKSSQNQNLKRKIQELKFQILDQATLLEKTQAELKVIKQQNQQLIQSELKRHNEQFLIIELKSMKEQNSQLLERCEELKRAAEYAQQMNERMNTQNFNHQNFPEKWQEEESKPMLRVRQTSRQNGKERLKTRYSSKRMEHKSKQDDVRSQLERKYFLR